MNLIHYKAAHLVKDEPCQALRISGHIISMISKKLDNQFAEDFKYDINMRNM